MKAPDGMKFTKSHEWVRLDDDVATIGVTDYAQQELGDITYLELPDVGDTIAQLEPLGVIESVKAANDIYSPVAGEVIERNEDAIGSPEMVNASPFGDAWLIKVRLSDPAQLEGLLDAAAYDEHMANEAH